ncbi:type III polyketide synthase [Paraflavitalea sp. CAU 1676]|uniref:type III polyketide synthase n=1 Tax=Paraflavitalea sp. CAU 1676 TaxID=3032598 RepID=UPI0023DA6CB0|nr:type III polyketide synthase [Paraflavitalea sp. CAU 1676]MDF2187475.1 type III polyketide synthase [Paraflavitalea sp. CAU 1676]
MSKIVSIGTAVPAFRHRQQDILQFMQGVYALAEDEQRKLRYLYRQSAIDTRYSVIPDYSRGPAEWKFYPSTENLEPFPALEQRMVWYNKYAAPLSIHAIRDCMDGKLNQEEITHLITVSCTGMSAPGLDLQLVELLGLPRHAWRSSVNFMGCYAAVHALKIADAICKSDHSAKVLIVCTELCTLHFQREATMDNIASGLLFADGSAAALITHDAHPHHGLELSGFYGEVIPKGRQDMSWELSSTGFLMTLSSYIPELIGADFAALTNRALDHTGCRFEEVGHWCIHPGGKKILEAVAGSLQLPADALQTSAGILRRYGNMSSPTILFVLKKIMQQMQLSGQVGKNAKVFGAAFGPGLTMETFVGRAV